MDNLRNKLQQFEFDLIKNKLASTQEFVSENSTSIILTLLIIIATIGIIIKLSRFLKYLKFMKTNPTFYFRYFKLLFKHSSK